MTQSRADTDKNRSSSHQLGDPTVDLPSFTDDNFSCLPRVGCAALATASAAVLNTIRTEFKKIGSYFKLELD
jgi:hypothetical protein